MTISQPVRPYTPQPQPQPQPFGSPPLTVILTVILLVFFFIGFFTLYFCKCFLESLMQAWYVHRNAPENVVLQPAATVMNNGLDPHIIRSFPSFPYSSVKDLRSEKYGLECAICLSEFSDDHVLRLLTKCYHVFHQECIDLWLESHKTCPVCRRDLEPSPSRENDETTHNEDIIIDVIRENEDDDNNNNNNNNNNNVVAGDIRSEQSSDRSKKETRSPPEKFPRSHSTGHSIVRNRAEEEDRYTLRLPEHVKIKMVRGHNQTESCFTFGELTTNRACGHCRFGEVSGQAHTTSS